MKTERNVSPPWVGAEGQCSFCNIDVTLDDEDIPHDELSGYIFIRRWEIACPYCHKFITVSKDI